MTARCIADDASWCWFESPRALVYHQLLLVGSVNSKGDIQLIVSDLETHHTQIITLQEQLEVDDHDSAAVHVRHPDKRLLVTWAKHGTENIRYYCISEHPLPTELPPSTTIPLISFSPIQQYIPSVSTELTYSNLVDLSAEQHRLYDFYRGLDGNYKPSYNYSDDQGATWQTGNIVIQVPTQQKHRPYVKYASNHVDTIHLMYTEAHPRDYDNSLYHLNYREGQLHHTDGTVIAALTAGLSAPNQGTCICAGSADAVCWIVDVVLDPVHHRDPYVVYSVQRDAAGLPVGQGGHSLHYYYAYYDRLLKQWQKHYLAPAGTCLYSGEDDYTGLAAIELDNPSIIYLSTNSHPQSGEPLISTADGQRHWELFQAETQDAGQHWTFAALTSNSTADQLRPIRPRSIETEHRALIWLHGKYRAYTDYSQQLYAKTWKSSR